MTIPLYLEDSYLKTCSGSVVEIGEDKSIILDKSIFYPTSGGQPGDKGFLQFNGGRCEIVTTRKGENGKIILVDDSLVRGTTSHKIVKMLYDAGAKEVHVRIACPEIKFPDFYGVDTPTKKELLAANKSNSEICEYIGAKSLKFLSVNGMYRAIGFDKRNETYPELTDHYFTGDYPVKPIDELGDSKITQLSLLNTASNN